MENVILLGYALLLGSVVAYVTNGYVVEKRALLKEDQGLLYKALRIEVLLGFLCLIIAFGFSTVMLYIFVLVNIALHGLLYSYMFFKKYFYYIVAIVPVVLMLIIALTVPSGTFSL